MREYLLLLIGLLYCAAGSTLTYVSVLLVTRKVNDYQLINDPRLPDIFLNLVPEYVFLFEFTESSIVIFLVLNIILFVLHVKKWLILKRTFVIFGTIFWVRFLTLMVTFFPIPNDRTKCPTEKYVIRGFRGVLQDLKGIILTFGLMNSGMVSCGDSMFSGHTASLVILASNFSHYIPKHLKPLRFIIWTWAFLAMLTILASHMHYTMDVVVGVWISRHVFTMYYQIVFLYEIYNASPHDISSSSSSSSITTTATTTIVLNNNNDHPNTNNPTINANAPPAANESIQLDHTIFLIDDDTEQRAITATYLAQNFGLFFWLNPIFVYFEKNAQHQENALVVPPCVIYIVDKIRTIFLIVKLRLMRRLPVTNTLKNIQIL